MSDWVIVPSSHEIESKRPSNGRGSVSSISSLTSLHIDGRKSIGRELLLPGVDMSSLVLPADGRKSLYRELLLPTVDSDIQQPEEEKSAVAEITKRHWVNSDDRANCINKECWRKFSLIDRPHHCRRCGGVFCNPCLKYKRKLSVLAQPDPEGKSYKVCKVCFDEGRGSDGASRSLTAEFKAFKIRGSETRAHQITGQQGLTVSRRQKVDLAKECQRLVNGFKKNIGTSEALRTLQEMKTVLKTPDWQKSSIWLQEKLAEKCQNCGKEFGLLRKKCSCKVCGMALCRSCASHELLIYIPDDSNRNIQEPEIAIIKVVGSPEVEPEISILLHACDSCKQYLVNLQVSRAENSLRSEEEEKIEGFVTKLIAVNKIVCGLEEKIVSQLSKYQDVIESLEDSRRTSGDRSNTQTLAKAQEDLSDHLASYVLKVQLLKKLQSSTQTDTQTTLYKNYFKCKTNFYLENMSTFRRLKTRLGESAPPKVLECIQKIVDKNAIISAQVYIRQLTLETLNMCVKYELSDTIPTMLTPLDQIIEGEVTSLLESGGEDCEEHKGHLSEIVKSQIKEHRLIRVSQRSLSKYGTKHATDIMKSRTQEILQQVSVQLDIKSINRSFMKTKKCLEDTYKQAQTIQVRRTTIKSRTGSKFGRIQPGTYELAALERLEKNHRLIMGEML